ncbi:magnesium-translocating P-type ATPase [Candidatus Gracilibacteria bacterium CG17_big_fil_post_rev_8_21_14_2_50_48_13]|nr:MAG: magnesium-translocating P-type ATPase [Candidatus Gracilibacteria bacterium CG17_big_fil_post_rev_8_21_14_2_50_48_13]
MSRKPKLGLSTEDARLAQKRYGRNVLVENKKRGYLMQYLAQFQNPLTLILLMAAGISFSVHSPIDGSIILTIILFSTLLNFFQEFRADNAAKKLAGHLGSRCLVLRDGKETTIHPREVVPEDVLVLRAGDLIPADAMLLTAKDFFVNESSLTGESLPVEKSPDFPRDRKKVFAGTNVITGSAQAQVFATGPHTQFGHIGKSLRTSEQPSAFALGIQNFSVFILKTSIFIVLGVFFLNSFLKGNILESLMFAIAIAVGITPELLPMILSITMSQGSLKMAKGGVIVKKLNAIPNFGSMDVLCTDKTGTLTQDKITVVQYINPFGETDEEVLYLGYLTSVFQTNIANPLDDALKSFRSLSLDGAEKVDEIPFDFVRRRMSVVVKKHDKTLLITKGAPEEIFHTCSHIRSAGGIQPLSTGQKAPHIAAYERLSQEGYRVLAVAQKVLEKVPEGIIHASEETDMVFMGYIAFLDPPKVDASVTVKNLAARGVTMKIITGDNQLVTQKVCHDLGIPVQGIVLGSEMANISDDALQILVEKTTIFARFSPQQKNRVILALQVKGHVVGYMGDGINDAPSLRTADIGISVSNAVDVAKESADIILTQKNLSALLSGITEGRRTFANSLKYIQMGVSSNFGNMFSVLGAVAFLPFLPMLPIQILLNNLLYDFSQITIPDDHVDEEEVTQPKKWNMQKLRSFMWTFGLMSSLFDFLTFFLLFSVFQLGASAFQTGWFMESLATQTLIIHSIRTQKIPFLESTAHPLLLASTFGVTLFGWIIPYTPLGKLFGFVPLDWPMLLLLGGIVLLYLLVVEIMKRLFALRHRG